ncbi:hypothetical protein [Bradyrhizobium sp. STM 3557]|uniref:hypothetical protein n=1 Tax=Bradyrhizobium sp. STM 3557 TaxID=578920 RepID=UPI003890D99F
MQILNTEMIGATSSNIINPLQQTTQKVSTHLEAFCFMLFSWRDRNHFVLLLYGHDSVRMSVYREATMSKASLRTNGLPSALALMIIGAIALGFPLSLLIIWVCS